MLFWLGFYVIKWGWLSASWWGIPFYWCSKVCIVDEPWWSRGVWLAPWCWCFYTFWIIFIGDPLTTACWGCAPRWAWLPPEFLKGNAYGCWAPCVLSHCWWKFCKATKFTFWRSTEWLLFCKSYNVAPPLTTLLREVVDMPWLDKTCYYWI